MNISLIICVLVVPFVLWSSGGRRVRHKINERMDSVSGHLMHILYCLLCFVHLVDDSQINNNIVIENDSPTINKYISVSVTVQNV